MVGVLKFALEALKTTSSDANSPASAAVEISGLKERFYRYLPAINKALVDSLIERDYFTGNPVKIRSWYLLVPFGLLVMLGFTAQAFLLASSGIMILIPLVASCLIVMIFGYFMPKWSDTGAQVAWKARGFKEFITYVEKYRAPWMEQQNIFESVLPYALAFGLGEKWAKAFEGVAMAPPNWYRGAATAQAFSMVAFAHSLDQVSSSIAAAAAPPQSRGSGSGSGGGGFSGGGGGGGGGGSW